MRPARCFAAVAVVAAAAVTSAPAASADDAAVFAAYTARQVPDLKAATDVYLKGVKRTERTDGRRGTRILLRGNRRINRVLRAIERDVRAQAPSSDAGTRARRAGLLEAQNWRRANQHESGALRSWILAGDVTPAYRAGYRRANRGMRRASRHGRIAVRAFREVGLASPVGSLILRP